MKHTCINRHREIAELVIIILQNIFAYLLCANYCPASIYSVLAANGVQPVAISDRALCNGGHSLVKCQTICVYNIHISTNLKDSHGFVDSALRALSRHGTLSWWRPGPPTSPPSKQITAPQCSTRRLSKPWLRQ